MNTQALKDTAKPQSVGDSSFSESPSFEDPCHWVLFTTFGGCGVHNSPTVRGF